MIRPRSRRTMIRWIPVCGPAPRRYDVSGAPEGSLTVKEIVAVPVCATRAGVNPESAKVRAGGIVGTFGREEPEQPASSKTAAQARRPRLIAGRLPSTSRALRALPRDLGDAAGRPSRRAARGAPLRAG